MMALRMMIYGVSLSKTEREATEDWQNPKKKGLHTANVKYCKSIYAIFEDIIWIGRVRFWVCYTLFFHTFVFVFFSFWLVEWALWCALYVCSWFSVLAKCFSSKFFCFFCFLIIFICFLMYRLATNIDAIMKSIENPMMFESHKVSYGDYVAAASFMRM